MDALSKNLKVILLLPTALVVIALYQDLFGAAQFLAELLRRWSAFWAVVWREVFAWLEPFGLSFPHHGYDMLTLMATLLAAIGLWPLLLKPFGLARDTRTVRDAVAASAPSAPTWFVTAFTLMLIVFASFVILFPFLQSQGTSIFIGFGYLVASVVEGPQPGDWVRFGSALGSLVSTTLFVGILIFTGARYVIFYERFVINTNFPWGDVILMALTLALCVYLYSFEGTDVAFSLTLLFLAPIFLLHGICRTSALSLVQIAFVVCGVLILDVLIRAGAEIWARTQGL